MRITLLALTMVAAAGAGCAAARVRAEAAPTLRCDADDITLEQPERPKDAWVATGCGRMAVCTLHAESDSEVACAGGASLSYSPTSYRPSAPEPFVAPPLKPRPPVMPWVGERRPAPRKVSTAAYVLRRR